MATANLLRKALQEILGGHMEWVARVVQAVSAHHGFHLTSVEILDGKPIGEPAEWAQARAELLKAYWNVLMPQEYTDQPPTIQAPDLAAISWLAGLTSAADWIASNPAWFPPGERYDDLELYYDDAKRLAELALDSIRWHDVRLLLQKNMPGDRLLACVTGRDGLKMRPLQEAGESLLGDASGPALLLVEAPMGEGKTEMAFLAHLRLQALNMHRGLYVAMPTQATGNAMFTRTLKFLENFRTGGLNIQLVHGGARMNDSFQRLCGINESERDGLAASAWFSQRRRPLLSHYGVGTVDQALLSVLNVKHHFVRLWGLSNRVVVLDEVHAYDTYTSCLIVTLLKWLKALGSSVILMSATLPAARRDELLMAWGIEQKNIPRLDYPRLLLADDLGVRGRTFSSRKLAPVHLDVSSEALEEMASRAMNLVWHGGCGAIIVNTVERAQNLYLILCSMVSDSSFPVEFILMHARFPADERMELEKKAIDFFGPDAQRPERALLIATQVAEQSLDLDFDFMLSDLAPVDLLLQRAGRLHRHAGRVRPEYHQRARLWVAGLERDRLPKLKETGWGYVYDAYILGRTWALLGKELDSEGGLQMPQDIERLVQEVYSHGELPDDVDANARELIETEFYGEFLAQRENHRQRARNVVIDVHENPQDAYSGKPRGNDDGDESVGLQNVTRMGSDSIILVPVEVAQSDWRAGAVGGVFPMGDPDEETAKRLYSRQIRISRSTIVNYFKKGEGADLVFKSPLLQGMYALPLQDGRYRIGGLLIRLDPVLGLVYENSNEKP